MNPLMFLISVLIMALTLLGANCSAGEKVLERGSSPDEILEAAGVAVLMDGDPGQPAVRLTCWKNWSECPNFT